MIETTQYENVPAHRARWMELCVNDSGTIDWLGYALLTSTISLREFLDLEEVAIVSRDRQAAWEAAMRKALQPGDL